MRKHTFIIFALAATVSACALDDQALDEQAPDDESVAVDASTDEPGTTAAASSAPACTASGPPGSGWVGDSSYPPPNACRKCQEAGRRLEASGKWRTHCMLLGGIGPALLFRFCVACLNGEGSAETPADAAQ